MRIGSAICLSALWHLFWFSSITVVSLPTKVQYPRFADISFLGSLLDEPSFEVHVAQKLPSRGPSVVFSQRTVEHLPFQPFSEEKEALLRIRLPDSKRGWGIPGEFLGLKKRDPSAFVKRESLAEQDLPPLEGPLVSRILYYRPSLPKLPRWIDPPKGTTHLKLRFWVSPQGKVVHVERMTSSGDPTLDTIGIRYLRRWQFNPKRIQEEEWGMVTLRFPLEPEE